MMPHRSIIPSYLPWLISSTAPAAGPPARTLLRQSVPGIPTPYAKRYAREGGDAVHDAYPCPHFFDVGYLCNARDLHRQERSRETSVESGEDEDHREGLCECPECET